MYVNKDTWGHELLRIRSCVIRVDIRNLGAFDWSCMVSSSKMRRSVAKRPIASRGRRATTFL